MSHDLNGELQQNGPVVARWDMAMYVFGALAMEGLFVLACLLRF